jgi:amino acid transporter
MSEDQRGRFGTFEGVFTPNILTILGLILFLRTGWVVGQAGMVKALSIVLLAAGITLITGLSLSVIATSLQVGAGGTYFVISRTLGAEAGGSIGIPLYLSQAVSVAFYIIGFTDAFVAAYPQFDPRLTSTVVALIFAAMAWVGADFAFKVQNLILIVLGASIVSFFSGGWSTMTEPLLTSAYTEGNNYWTVFAVFFPAVTGIAVGASMSGDLKNPAESIPKGTLYSIGVSTLVYVLTVVWLGYHGNRSELLTNNLIVKDIAYWPGLIFAGIYAATLSSALGSILAAPRTLEALANDKVVPERLKSRIGSKTEPRMAVLLTTVIALITIWAGDLDVVAPVITMFFLNTYGVVNLAAGVQLLVDNPSFRPSFKMPWWLSLAGAFGCYGTMLLIHTPATIVAIVVSIGIYVQLERRSLERTWGDVRSGFWFALARRALVQLENVTWHVKNWRPSILVFTGQPHNREHLVEMAEWLSTGKGIVTFVQLVPGDPEYLMKSGAIGEAKDEIERYIKERGMQAFGTSIAADSFVSGSDVIMQSHGVGGLSSNAILMGMGGTAVGLTVQMHKVRRAALFGKSVLMLRHHPERSWGSRSTIDVWWGGMGSNAPLMLLLAHLVKSHRDWHGATIRLLQVVDDESKFESSLGELNRLLEAVRVKAEPKVLVKDEGVKIGEIIRRESTPTDLTLLGLQTVEQDEAEDYAKALIELTQDVGSSLIVHSLAGGEILHTS